MYKLHCLFRGLEVFGFFAHARAIAELDTDGTYILTTDSVEES